MKVWIVEWSIDKAWHRNYHETFALSAISVFDTPELAGFYVKLQKTRYKTLKWRVREVNLK